MKTKEQIEHELIEKAKQDAEKAIALAKEKADKLFKEQQKEEEEKRSVKEFLNGFPLITGRKWYTGVDDGIQTFFSKAIGTDTDGVELRISFYLNLWISEGYCHIDQDKYSSTRNRSAGYLGQLMWMCGDLQMDYDDQESEDGGSHKNFLLDYAKKAIPEMAELEKECKRLLKEIKKWDDEKLEMLESLLEEVCKVESYKTQPGSRK
jgi:hypothetical protein